MAVCRSGNVEALKLMLNQGARVNSKDGASVTPLHIAAGAGHVEIIELLLNAGARIEAKDNEGYTPLMRAITDKRLAAVQYLISRGANVRAETKTGCNCLALTVFIPDEALRLEVRALIDNVLNPRT